MKQAENNAGERPQNGVALEESLSWLLVGPILLALVTGLQFTLWMWKKYPARTPDWAEFDRLTLLGREMYRPEYDIYIYLGGLFFSLLLATACGTLWRRRLLAVCHNNELHRIRLNLLLHFPIAGSLVFLPLFFPLGRDLPLAAGCIGLIYGIVAFRMAGRSTHAIHRWLHSPSICRYGVETVLIVLAIVSIVFVPDASALSRMAYTTDYCHHVDFFAMSPALACSHGAALNTEFLSQYGVGWPMVLAFLTKLGVPLSYRLFFQVCVVWACLYFLVLYVFLRLLCRSMPWAIVGLLLALLLQFFGGAQELPKWIWPASTIMRYPMDVLFFTACLLHLNTGKTRYSGLTGFLAAMAVLFSTDTGLYLSVCLVVYLVVQRRLPHGVVGQAGNLSEASQNTLGFARHAMSIGCPLLTFAVTLLLGLSLASRGTLTQPEFWDGWTITIRTYGTGLNNLPIARMLQDNAAGSFFLIVMLVCNLFVACRMLQEAVFRTLTPQHLIVGLVGLYGLEALLLFVGRSHPYNLHHPSIPFCVVAVCLMVEICRTIGRKLLISESRCKQVLFRASLATAPCLVAYVLLLLICAHAAFQNYPNVFWQLGRNGWNNSRIPDENYLFLSRHDCPLPDGSRGHVADFRAITAAMRELSDGGQRSVAMVDCFETAYLVEADLRPYFLYSPVIHSVMFKEQAEPVERQLVENPPDYVFLPTAPPRTVPGIVAEDVYRGIFDVIRRHFTLDRNVANMAVYRRQGLAVR